MKIIDILSNSQFSNKKVIEKLIAYYMNITKEDIFKHYELEVESDLYDKILDSYNQFFDQKKPLEYILGHVPFFGIKFKVNSDTLIPRPETEYMIKAINDFIQSYDNKKFMIWDIGTGCGVLGLSTLYFNSSHIQNLYLTDFSEGALKVASDNYQSLFPQGHKDVLIEKSDFLSYFQQSYSNSVDDVILIANLPYIPEKTFDEEVEENVKNWEPRMAFVGGDDGLIHYRTMFSQLISLKNNNQIANLTMFLEMMTWQTDILEQEYVDMFKFEIVETFHFNIKIIKAYFK